MRASARILVVVVFALFAFSLFRAPAYAQTDTSQSTAAINSNYLTPDADPNVPQNHHSYTQIVLIDMLSAITCELVGVDPSAPQQPCLGVDPTTGKIGLAAQPQTFGQANPEPQVGGALGLMAQSISALYVPAVGTSDYVHYLSSDFGIVKNTYAQIKPGKTDCNANPFGYGFCGLSPILPLWSDIRDLAYALLTILFIAIGIGVMLRFRVDPRTVMTLQNQIPRVIIAILLITFSYAIAGALVDVMWTVTYAGVNFIDQTAPATKVALCPPGPQPINRVIETRLTDQPISFTNTIFRTDCNALVDNGLLSLSGKVAGSLGDLVQQLIHDAFFSDSNVCHGSWFNGVPLLGTVTTIIGGAKCLLQSGAMNVFIWLTEHVVMLIIIIALLIALFRLWFQLIKCYLTFLIFVIMGPIWIVLGLIPGRPMGFEKWLRIVFSNLAVFPLVAFLLVFARVIVDSVPSGPGTPNTFFVPPLVGNPNLTTFSTLIGFGAVLIAPTIPDLIKERMKATGQAKYGATIAAGVGMATAAFTAPGRRIWESQNRRNPTTGEPEGPLAVRRAQWIRRMPGIGRKVIQNDARRRAVQGAYRSGDWSSIARKEYKQDGRDNYENYRQARQQQRQANPRSWRHPFGGGRNRGGQPPTGGSEDDNS